MVRLRTYYDTGTVDNYVSIEEVHKIVRSQFGSDITSIEAGQIVSVAFPASSRVNGMVKCANQRGASNRRRYST